MGLNEDISDIEQGKVEDSAVPVEINGGSGNVEQWRNSFNAKLGKAKSPVPASCCIFKVPKVLKRQKKESYEPDIVSIGPYHRSGEKFRIVENVKEWYLKCLLKRLDMKLDDLIDQINGLQACACSCYSELCISNPNDFVEMLILDGCFLIELFRKEASEDRQDNDDPIFNVSCMLEYLYHDLLLLENQLPWFVLEFFYDLIERDNPKKEPLIDVVINFFKLSVAEPAIFDYPKPDPSHPDPTTPSVEIFHILDLIRTALVQTRPTETHPTDPGSMIGKLENKKKSTSHLPRRIPNATALSEAGVTFKKGTSNCILNIEFKNGVFTIPSLAIDERTGPLFRNLMAFEQCYHSCVHRITSYAVIMDNLIDTSEDVDLLCEKGILSNWLSDEDAANFFNDLYTDTTVINYHYKSFCEEVHRYHRARWNKYREKLKRDYFDTPWSTISFVAAFVLLVLTFLQTVYTIQTYYHPS